MGANKAIKKKKIVNRCFHGALNDECMSNRFGSRKYRITRLMKLNRSEFDEPQQTSTLNN